MSSPPPRDELIAAIVRATADLATARGSYTAGVAERLGLATTDVDVLRLLADEGAMPVGRIGELTTLTTGATTRLIDRLEQAGYVRRAPDPADRRRVIVAPVPERVAVVTAAFEPIDEAIRDALADHAPDALADVLAYLDACLAALRSSSPTPADAGGTAEGGAVNAPIASATAGRLVFVTGAPHVTIGSDPTLGAELYRARFAGAIPSARVRDGAVTIRFPRFAWFDWRVRIGDNRVNASGHWRRDATDVLLNTGLPWRIEFRGGMSSATLDLRAVRLEELTFSGGVGSIDLRLGVPIGVVPITLSGGATDVTIRRPSGVPLRLALSGGFNTAVVDGQRHRGDSHLDAGDGRSPDRFEVRSSGGVNNLAISAA